MLQTLWSVMGTFALGTGIGGWAFLVPYYIMVHGDNTYAIIRAVQDLEYVVLAIFCLLPNLRSSLHHRLATYQAVTSAGPYLCSFLCFN